MFNRNVIDPPTRAGEDALYRLVVGLRDGEQLSHRECEQILGVSRRDATLSRYWHAIGRVRRRLMADLGVELINRAGVGFERATGEAQVRSGVGRSKRGIRQVARGFRTVAAVVDDRLPGETARRQRDHIVASGHTLLQQARVAVRQVTVVLNKPEALPSFAAQKGDPA